MECESEKKSTSIWKIDLLGQYIHRQNYAIQIINSEQVLKLSHLGTQKKKIMTIPLLMLHIRADLAAC